MVRSVSAFTMRQRPNDRDHTQHPSGTAERNTLRQLYSVNSVPTLGRMAVEQHGERSKDLKVF